MRSVDGNGLEPIRVDIALDPRFIEKLCHKRGLIVVVTKLRIRGSEW